jgi:hypothetical protein
MNRRLNHQRKAIFRYAIHRVQWNRRLTPLGQRYFQGFGLNRSPIMRAFFAKKVFLLANPWGGLGGLCAGRVVRLCRWSKCLSICVPDGSQSHIRRDGTKNFFQG